MNCKLAKSQLALLVGNDLEPAAVRDVRRHLDECDGCREHLRQLSLCAEALQARDASWNAEGESLWPELAVRLASQAEPRKPERFNGWAPALAAAAVCTAMFWLTARDKSPEIVATKGQPQVGQPVVDVPDLGESTAPEDFLKPAPRRSDDGMTILKLRSHANSQRPFVVPVNLQP